MVGGCSKNPHRHPAAGEESTVFKKTLKNEILCYVQDDTER
jgi:hypothetical protein